MLIGKNARLLSCESIGNPDGNLADIEGLAQVGQKQISCNHGNKDMNEERSKMLSALPPRLHNVVQPWSDYIPDQLALVEAGGAWTYRELEIIVERTGTWLAASGVRPGDRVMIVSENCRAFVAIFFALSRINAVPVPVNAWLSETEVDAIRHHCGARLVLYLTSVSSHALEHANRTRAVIAENEDLGIVGLGSLEKSVPESIDPDPANAVATIFYTSGTTGKPKGVMLTHRNLLFSATVSAGMRLLKAEDRISGVLPMSHVTGLVNQLLGGLVTGATVHLLPRFDPLKAIASLQNERLTVMYGVPFMFTQFLEYARIRRLESLRFPSLRVISCAGAPLLPTVKLAVEQLFGIPIQHAYGLTECSPGISITRLDAPRNDTSVGQIYPYVEVKLVGLDREQLVDGEVGELWVRGPNVMKGYYRAPEETAAAIDSEGWFNTRDLAKMENGNLFIVGRSKELIIRFGFNVYPAEVEGALNRHPAVTQSVVIGRLVEETGEQEIVAIVQPRLGSNITTKELNEHVARYLAHYKRPTHIYLMSELPRTPSGKIVKEQLAKMLEGEVRIRNGKC
jgi:acyl-CoA synthetase (AMP-forming)/AMP-acid ligase II